MPDVIFIDGIADLDVWVLVDIAAVVRGTRVALTVDGRNGRN